MGLLNRNKIGLALGSGGARGLAHIGVIKTLVKHQIPIDFIAGSSAGALVGGIYAAFKDIDKVEKIASEATYQDFFKAFADPSFLKGLVKGDHVVESIEKFVGKVRIENLKIPFKAVATNIVTGRTIAIGYGSLAKGIRASTSLPFVFDPVKIGKHYLIDGGASQPVPVQVVREMGADKVIAVNLNEMFFSQNNKTKKLKDLSTISIVKSTIYLLMYHLARENVKGADIVINPDVPRVPLIKIVHGEELIQKGEEAMEKEIPRVKELLKKDLLSF